MGSDIVSPTRLKERMTQIQQLVKEVFEKDVHFGAIPGCGDKPALFKAGAELACAMFRLVPKFDVSEQHIDGGHYRVRITCSLYGPDGSFWGQGLGSATTMESKHRYRGFEAKPTDRGVPSAYWNAKRSNDMKRAQELLGGAGFIAKKINGNWMICEATGEKQENTDPADQENTVLKMAKKRSLSDAVLTATGMSAIFTQDMAELEEMIDKTPSFVEPIDGGDEPRENNDQGRNDHANGNGASNKKAAETSDDRVKQCRDYFAKNGLNESMFRVLIGGKRLEEADDGNFELIRETCVQIKKGDQDMGRYEAALHDAVVCIEKALDSLPEDQAETLLKGVGKTRDDIQKITAAKDAMLIWDVVKAACDQADDMPF